MPPLVLKKYRPTVNAKVTPRRLLTGNGCHKAVGIVQGIIQNKNSLLIPEGNLTISISKKLKNYLKKNPNTYESINTYIGYPKVVKGIIENFDIIGVDEANKLKESWEFIGAWCSVNNSILVQRDTRLFNNFTRLPFFKIELEYDHYMWINNYCYRVICTRTKTQLIINQVQQWACPI